MRLRDPRFVALLIVLAALAGCASRAERFSRLKTEVTAFGGLGRDPSGAWIVYTFDAGAEPEVENQINSLFGRSTQDSFVVAPRSAPGVATADQKTQALGAVGGVSTITFVDYDETLRLVRIGFSDPDDLDAIEAALSQAGIDLGAVLLEVNFGVAKLQ
jgi:hypothetical protein